MKIYQLYDLKAELPAGPLMSERKDNIAIRTFHSILANKDTLPGQYPEHFQLRLLGTQDEDDGEIHAHFPEVIATGAAWLDTQQRPAEPLTLTA